MLICHHCNEKIKWYQGKFIDGRRVFHDKCYGIWFDKIDDYLKERAARKLKKRINGKAQDHTELKD